MARLRINFITGTLGASLGTGGTTITFNAAPNIGNISAPNYLPLVISPSSYGVVGTTAPEIVWITSYTAGSTTATISRAQEGTSSPASWPIGTVWANSPTVSDFDVQYLTSSGTLTLNNGLNVTNGGNAINVPNGNIVVGGNLTVSGYETVVANIAAQGASFSNLVITGGDPFGSTAISALHGSITVGNAATIGGEIYALNTGTAISAPNGNVVVGGNLTAGSIALTAGPINNVWYTNTVTNPSIPLGNGSGSANIYGTLTVSGYTKYLITANVSYVNSAGGAANEYVYGYLSGNSVNSSTQATSIGSASQDQRAQLHHILSLSGLTTGNYTFTCNAYTNNNNYSTTASTIDFTVIGLS